MALPRSWAEVETGLAYLFGGGGGHGPATARELLVQAILARYGVESLHDLERWRRQIAFQKSIGAYLALAEEANLEGDLVFRPAGVRKVVVATFAAYFDGAAIEGPPWRLDPSEQGRPTYEELAGAASFDDPPFGGETLVPESVR